MKRDQRALVSLRRDNFFAFYAWAFHVLHPHKALRAEHYVYALAFAMEEFAKHRRRRQLIAVPPRHGKSLMASVALCAWILGRNPTAKILVASYGADLAAKHARDFRTIINHDEFKRIFPECVIKRFTADEIETMQGGIRRAVTPGSSTTGFGADFIIIDDLTKVGDARSDSVREAANAYVDESLYTRFDEKAEGGILAIQQRTHERDVIGHLRDKGEWHELILPAIAQENQSFSVYGGNVWTRRTGEILSSSETLETLDEIKATMGPQAFSAQYLQDPVPLGGNRVMWHWFEVYNRTPHREELLYVLQSWDTALSELPGSDYSVCVTLAFFEGKWLVIDVCRRRLNFGAQCAEAERLYRRWQPDRILIEQASTGGALADQLKRRLKLGRSRIELVPPRVSKEERVEIHSHRIEAGDFAVPIAADWLAEFRSEVTGFPAKAHDDQVDALFQAISWIASRRGRSLTNIDPISGLRIAASRPRGRDYSAYCR